MQADQSAAASSKQPISRSNEIQQIQGGGRNQPAVFGAQSHLDVEAAL
jgi:hypothetical protein